ncbi:hypothetical protein BpHYR1_032561 [Brachionus plicatilis]|uniref:Uncharacterized protein n=1 Tax=Brachionus plicatilis TaxID=10195 RepID=A0A3M7RRF9_BRAPC|nr:hypothetical protein BpHYR1_032561 [Brachionus plicatilis]
MKNEKFKLKVKIRKMNNIDLPNSSSIHLKSILSMNKLIEFSVKKPTNITMSIDFNKIGE